MLLCVPVAFALLCLASAQNDNLVAVSNPSAAQGTGISGLASSSSSNGVSAISAIDLPFSRFGKCINANINHANANFSTLASERNGYWLVAAVPYTSDYANLIWAHLHIEPTTAPDNYLLTLYTQVQNEELHRRLQLLVIDTSFGYAAASTTGLNSVFFTLKIYITDFSSGSYALLYICSDDGGDIGVDDRIVIGHKWPLTNSERTNIYNKDKTYPFRGGLVML